MKLFQQLQLNWKSGLSIAIVSLPLSLSFAIASGASPIMGIITSGWAGLVGAFLGGSKFNVISPAGAFAGILTGVSLTYGPEAIPIVTILAGGIMGIGYLLKAEKFLKFIPGGAIFGFSMGIAAIIAGTQIQNALGVTDLAPSDSILGTIWTSLQAIPNAHLPSVGLFLALLGLLFILKKLVPKIPSVIIVAPLSILIGRFTPGLFITLTDLYGNLAPNLIQFPTSFKIHPGFISPAITIAAVGILETMLSAKVADGQSKTKHNKRREMLGLSVANIVSGLFGGMPATGVLGPTVLNIQSGATGRASAALKAVFVLGISALLFSWFGYLPMPAIAAILFFVALSMIERHRFALYYTHERFSLAIAGIVAVVTLVKDPATGILLGSVLGLLVFAEKVSRGDFEARINKTDETQHTSISNESEFSSATSCDTLVYSMRGVLSHLNADAHIERIESLDPKVSTLILRLREIAYMDMEGATAFDSIVDVAKSKDITVYISALPNHVQSFLEKHSTTLALLQKENNIFSKTRFALLEAGIPLKEE